VSLTSAPSGDATRQWRETPVHRPRRSVWLAIVPAGCTLRARDLPPAAPALAPKWTFRHRRNWAFMADDRLNNLLISQPGVECMSEAEAADFAITKVNRVRRMPARGRYDRQGVYSILDAAVVCHISYVIDGRPYCTPTGFWREDDHLYWHGSAASRMIRAQSKGLPVCLTVTHLDALVMARSGFHHSVNYRAVMAFGTAHAIDDRAEKLRLMDNFIDRIYPGRSKLIRQPNIKEFKSTTLMGMEIETASAKIRNTHVADEEEDYEAVPAWSALYPIYQVLGEKSECARQRADLRFPEGMADFVPGARLDDVLSKSHAKTFGKRMTD
jgi:nitroimidazol reductase NimA-like FMN-containing flavoprotein (pyridoxamine 5'-phosphate oxidase superfamily)